MIQRLVIAVLAIILITLGGGSCEQSDNPREDLPAGGETSTGTYTVVSLSPAATDLLVGMGLADRLIGVSNFEPPRPETDSLPRVGDYRSADWEKLSRLKPSMVITQYRDDKMPDGFAQRCADLGIRIFNRKIDSLSDVFETIGELGSALGASAGAEQVQQRWTAQLSALQSRLKDRPRPLTLIVVGETGLSAVGPGTFLDDLLRAAGGQNVLAGGNDYVTLDREKLASLDPEAIIQLLPAAAPQQIEQAAAFWKSMPMLRAVKNARVHQIMDADVLLPGFNCPRTAERFAEFLHGAPATRPASPSSGTGFWRSGTDILVCYRRTFLSFDAARRAIPPGRECLGETDRNICSTESKSAVGNRLLVHLPPRYPPPRVLGGGMSRGVL